MQKKIYKALILLLMLFLLAPAWGQETAAEQNKTANSWEPPDIVFLPVDWWSKFISEDPTIFRQHADLFVTSIEDYINNLDADNLIQAQARVKTLRANLDAAIALQGDPPALKLETLPILDAYSLPQFFNLKTLLRAAEEKKRELRLEQQQLKQQKATLEERYDLNLIDYKKSDPSSALRVLSGLYGVNTYLDLYIVNKKGKINSYQQDQVDTYISTAEDKLSYAADHLVDTDLNSKKLAEDIQKLTAQATSASSKLLSIQKKLLAALNADEINTYLVLNLKQHLTMVSAEETLAKIKAELLYAERDWYLVKQGLYTSSDQLHKSDTEFNALLKEVNHQLTLWTTASQNTLITPAPAQGRTAKKLYNEAQSHAHTTLGLISQINTASDNLSLMESQVAKDLLSLQNGVGNVWLRIKIFSQNIWDQANRLLNLGLFHLGNKPITTGGIVKAIFIFLMFWVVSWLIRHFLDRLEQRQHFEQGSFYASGRVLHYIILTVALLAALGSFGLDFSSFALIAGALSVGIGFGLQSIVLNFVSGLVLLFEGSIRVGDYVELDSNGDGPSLMGSVKEIRSRATLINTNDNIDVVVPNSELVSNRLINWTLKESIARMRIPFSVAYGSDKALVQKAALEAVEEGVFCIQHTPGREPAVRMLGFGDSALNFELRVWVNRQGVRRPIYVRSSIYWAMDNKFKEYGVTVPFPQTDVHITPMDPGLPESSNPT